eukprot:Plantae.Rhodophyta-Purpureofilum_apyrenoidigerum.ctg10666.p1 GENE.Plantae.Rhodophyta-Purpureofilum_apyrenoidigerum.ctg10666~~Plantae.Rhodophyta-Purpureofilum_apyrenoidigerum.ctg10666.p1  ORF type:complete len:239 (-),score=42.04 Plantae.Rhodophyta-Purpureofilum_apyrenoidigerum.ctg10666:68-784(-)
MGDLSRFRKFSATLCMEFLGALALTYAIQAAAGTNKAMIPLAAGSMLMVMVYVGSKISGAHFNPSVSIAMWLRGKQDLGESIQYIAAQLLGATLGAFLGFVSVGSRLIPKVGEHHNFLQAMFAEVIFTALLVTVVLATTTMSSTENNQYFGAAIGFIVFVGSVCVGTVSGGMFNPAVSVALVVVGHWGKLLYLLFLVLAQVGGAILGAVVFFFIAPEDMQDLDLSQSAREAREKLINS